MFPPEVRRLFWDVDPDTIRLEKHGDYVLERVMTEGDRAAMRWLRETFSNDVLRGFLVRRGGKLPARERAYWNLIACNPAPQEPGGGSPAWLR